MSAERSLTAADAYRQGHLDACKDDRCALLPDASYPSFRDGVTAGEERVRQEVALLIERVRDLAWKATQYGSTEDGDTAAYIVPKGVMHRLVGEAQAHGFTSVAFRDPSRPTPPASDSHASVSPEQTPTPADDSAHSSDQCPVQNKENP